MKLFSITLVHNDLRWQHLHCLHRLCSCLFQGYLAQLPKKTAGYLRVNGTLHTLWISLHDQQSYYIHDWVENWYLSSSNLYVAPWCCVKHIFLEILNQVVLFCSYASPLCVLPAVGLTTDNQSSAAIIDSAPKPTGWRKLTSKLPTLSTMLGKYRWFINISGQW